MTKRLMPGLTFWAALAINLLLLLALLPLAAQAGGISCTKGFGSDSGANGDGPSWWWPILAGGFFGAASGMLGGFGGGGLLGGFSGPLGGLAGSLGSMSSDLAAQAAAAASRMADGAAAVADGLEGPMFPTTAGDVADFGIAAENFGSAATFVGGLAEGAGALGAGAIGYGIGESPIGTALGNAVGIDQTAAQNSALGNAVNTVCDYLGLP